MSKIVWKDGLSKADIWEIKITDPRLNLLSAPFAIFIGMIVIWFGFAMIGFEPILKSAPPFGIGIAQTWIGLGIALFGLLTIAYILKYVQECLSIGESLQIHQEGIRITPIDSTSEILPVYVSKHKFIRWEDIDKIEINLLTETDAYLVSTVNTLTIIINLLNIGNIFSGKLFTIAPFANKQKLNKEWNLFVKIKSEGNYYITGVFDEGGFKEALSKVAELRRDLKDKFSELLSQTNMSFERIEKEFYDPLKKLKIKARAAAVGLFFGTLILTIPIFLKYNGLLLLVPVAIGFIIMIPSTIMAIYCAAVLIKKGQW